MTKIAIINDTHFGVRSDSILFLEHQKKFYQNIFFPTLKNKGIKTIFHLGDLLDRRKYINFNTLSFVHKEFLGQIPHDTEMYLCLGNHDVSYKNTNELNGPELLIDEESEYNPVHIIRDIPKEVYGCLLVPWITAENQDNIMKAMKETDAKVCMGHFEISGFEMLRGQVCDHGMDKIVFDKFHQVYSGHFHHPSEYGNIKYLGAPYEMTWSDAEGKRGFHIFDTETYELEFISNPYTVFEKVYYDDTEMTVDNMSDYIPDSLTNKYIKIIIKERTNPYLFDLFHDQVQQTGAFDIKIIEDKYDLMDISEDELIDEAQDTGTILNNYIDNIETDIDKTILKQKVNDLYKEALSV